MAFNKDSLIIELAAAADGYAWRAWRWDVSPPPVPWRDMDQTMKSDGSPPDHIFKISADKTELKTELASIIDNNFDV